MPTGSSPHDKLVRELAASVIPRGEQEDIFNRFNAMAQREAKEKKEQEYAIKKSALEEAIAQNNPVSRFTTGYEANAAKVLLAANSANPLLKAFLQAAKLRNE